MARKAKSLDVLLAEVNAAFPNRSKRSDGWIGDPAHAARASRHNPNNAGVVCAIDITHDPASGCDIHALARRLVLSPHPDLEYVISNGQVAKRRNGFAWERYTGSNAHTQHAHFAVGRGPDSEPTPPYDTTTPWGVAGEQSEQDDMPYSKDEIKQMVHESLRDFFRDHIEGTDSGSKTLQVAAQEARSGREWATKAAILAKETLAAVKGIDSGTSADANAIVDEIAERLKT